MLTNAPIRVIRRLALLTLVLAAWTGCTRPGGPQRAREVNASADLAFYRTHGPEINTPLTLADALQYADRYNIEAWLAAQETKLQHELATQATLKMLPSLMTGAGYDERSRYDAASSVSFGTRKESLEPSFSSERQTRTFDISATWYLLDFGMSFLRAQQQGNRILIAAQRERRIRQNLALEVTRAYWQAVPSRESARQAEIIDAQISTALGQLRKEIEDKAIAQVDGLQRETTLLQQQEELRRYERDYDKGMIQLARLIGLPPGASFTLAEVDLDRPLAAGDDDVAVLELEALHHRPELFEKDFEEAISRDEVHIALAELLPAPALFWQHNFDRNRYLVFNSWNTVGIRASWDLLTLPQQFKQIDAVKMQTEMVARQRTALAVGVLMQLHLAMIDQADARDRCQSDKVISDKCAELIEAVRSQVDEGKTHGGQLLDQQLRGLRARAKYWSTRAELMIAQARVLNTVGRDQQGGPPPLEVGDAMFKSHGSSCPPRLKTWATQPTTTSAPATTDSAD